MNKRERILKDFEEIQQQLSRFIDKCDDKASFTLEGKLYEDFKTPIENLIDKISKFNVDTTISGELEIDLNGSKKILLTELNKIPNLILLFKSHLNSANLIIKEYTQKQISSETEKEFHYGNEYSKYLSALKLRDVKIIRERYKILNSEISSLKLELNSTLLVKNINPIKLKPEYLVDEKIENFRKVVLDLVYLNEENSELFISLLKGNFEGKVIDWMTNQANIWRVITALRKYLTNRPKWQELDKLFTINGNNIKDLKNSTTKRDTEIDKIINDSFDFKTK